MLENNPIGVFDSGLGGLSVLAPLHALLPSEDLLYLADSRFAPYGPRSAGDVLARCEYMMDCLEARGAKAVVVACNTATAVAVNSLRQQYALPIIAMEPGLKPAAEQSRSGIIGVLATEGTLASDRFMSLKSRFATQVEIITVPCPGLVEAIERGPSGQAERRELLARFIQPLLARGVDTLTLGCTHYPLILPDIVQVAGPSVRVLDTGPAVAREVQRRLREEGLLRAGNEAGRLAFLTSGDPLQQSPLMSHYWQQAVTVAPLDRVDAVTVP